MAPKKQSEKKESGKSKKADNEAKKAQEAAEAAERKEAAKWDDGSKAKKAKDVDKESKKAADAARKAEAARLLAEEEASMSIVKPKPVGGAKKKSGKKHQAPAGPGAIAAGGGQDVLDKGKDKDEDEAPTQPEKPEEFSATGLDSALEMMTLVTAKGDKASVGQAAAGIESHPERRFKATFEAYKERELPNLKLERPGLRLQQYQEILFKQFQKSPENPFNQQTIAYDAAKEERVDALKRQKERDANRYRAAA